MSDALRDGRFVQLGPLGEGSQGRTFDGVDKREGRAVAIKRFDVRGARAWKDVELAEREARVLASLSHPKLPAYVDHFEEGGALYLVMEKIEGESLAALRKRGAVLGEEDVVQLLRDAADVLEYLHGRAPPVFHRDLKPGNVLLRPDRTFAFVDFGAVRDRLRPEGGSTVVGTFGYMAPEQFQGRALPASDVYAIGATAVAMLTGEEPESLPHKGLAIDVETALRGRASRKLIDVLKQMLDPDPDRRASRIGPLVEGLSARASERPRDARASERPRDAGASERVRNADEPHRSEPPRRSRAAKSIKERTRELNEALAARAESLRASFRGRSRSLEREVERLTRELERRIERGLRELRRDLERRGVEANEQESVFERFVEEQTRAFEREIERRVAAHERRRARRRAMPPWPWPLALVASLGLTAAIVAVALALQVVVPLVLTLIGLFGLRKPMAAASAAVRSAGKAAVAAMHETRRAVQQGTQPLRAEEAPRARVEAVDPPRVRVVDRSDDPALDEEDDLEAGERRRRK